MKKFFISFFTIFIFSHNIIFKYFDFPFLKNNWDEIIEVFLFLFTVIYLSFNKKQSIKKDAFTNISLLLLIIIIGIIGNFTFGYVSEKYYIIKDIISFLKFPIVFFVFFNLLKNTCNDNTQYSLLNRFVNIFIIIIFSLGLISLFKDIGLSQNSIRNGIRPYQFLYTHPTYLVLNSLLMLVIHLSTNKRNNKIDIYDIFIGIIIILSMRTKGIATISVYFFIKYFSNSLKKFKFIYIISIIAILFFISNQKVSEYASYSTSAREVFYKETITITSKCFPLGSGFGSYASHISRQANSKVYNFIHIPLYYVNGKLEYSVYGDTGYPYYIGQFGIIGFILIVILFYRIYRKSIVFSFNKYSIYLIWLYIIIALTSESILVNNGIELAFTLAFASTINLKEKNIITKKQIN